MRQADWQTVFARDLRHRMTRSERIMWWQLRDRRVNGLTFRRQVPLGPYVADFLCPSLRSVIEIDGGQHADNRADDARDADLAARGYRRLRVWNCDILTNISRVTQRLAEEIAS